MTTNWTTQNLAHFLQYILTDASDYVLVGQNSDEVLIWDEPTQWANQTKN